MTESEWLSSTDPTAMLEYLRGKASDRKLRLFAVACCRRIWVLLTDGRSRAAVELCERWVDGLATSDEVEVVQEAAYSACRPDRLGHKNYPAKAPAYLFDETEAIEDVAIVTAIFASEIEISRTEAAERSAQTHLLRDIFGNPFRPVSFSPEWLTQTVTTLAQQTYDTRDFSAMPILADALQDAGCSDDQVLAHCRGLGPHVRGCWIIDLLTSRR